MGFEESAMLQRMMCFWPSVRSRVGTIRKGPAGVRSQVQACGGRAVLQGRQETGKEQGLTRVLCSPFPLPDQHWSDDVPSDADAELQLRVSENEEEQPPVTAWHQERGQSAIAGEATPRTPAESHVKTSGTKGTGPRAEPAHRALASGWPPPLPAHRPCTRLYPQPLSVCYLRYKKVEGAFQSFGHRPYT